MIPLHVHMMPLEVDIPVDLRPLKEPFAGTDSRVVSSSLNYLRFGGIVNGDIDSIDFWR